MLDHSLEELASVEQRALVACCDVLVAGRFIREHRSTSLRWRGSANQTVHFLTDRYREDAFAEAGEFEVHIARDGGLTLTGFPPHHVLGD